MQVQCYWKYDTHVGKSHVRSKQHTENLERRKAVVNEQKYISSVILFFPGSAVWARFGGPAGELSGAAVRALWVSCVPAPLSQGHTEKPLRADKSHIPAWPSCTPRQNKHAFLQKPCCSHCWGGGGCAGLLTLSHMQILQLKSKSALENPNQRDATQSLCPVQVFVIRTTRSFYNHNMQCNAVGFY